MKYPNVNDKELSDLLHVAMDAALEARKIHMSYYKKLTNIRNKQDLSLVSEADQASEKAIRNIVRKKFPDIDILGEEGGLEKRSSDKSRWLIDPLDGTTNYIHGYPFFCSSIALEMDGRIVIGVVDVGIFQKTYWAVKGHGAYINDSTSTQKISVSESPSVKDSLVGTGFSAYGGKTLEAEMAVFKKLIEKSRGVRRSGSAALELCFLAEGALDGFWEYGLKPWDTGAGSIIVQEAGGVVTNEKGEKFHPDHNVIVASNGLVHPELLTFLK